MRKIFSLLWLAIGLNFASAQAIDPVGGGTSSLVPGTTPTGCTALSLFYADSSSNFGCMAGTSWDNTNRSLTITGATVTTSKPVLDLSQTWNGAGVTFTGLKFNATNTASATTSMLLDLQVEGVSMLKVDRLGGVTSANGINIGIGSTISSASGSRISFTSNGVLTFWNNAFNDFGRINLGGTTASFPALKRSGTTLAFRLADDSADAGFSGALFTTSSAVLMASSVALTDGAAAAVGTLTNAPAAGNPTKWVPINDNGTTRYVPAW